VSSTGLVANQLIGHDDGARIGCFEVVNAVQQRTLPRSRGADYAYDLGLLTRQTDATEHLVIAKRLTKVLDDQQGSITHL